MNKEVRLIQISNGWLVILPASPDNFLGMPAGAFGKALKAALPNDEEYDAILQNAKGEQPEDTTTTIPIDKDTHFFKTLKDCFKFLSFITAAE